MPELISKDILSQGIKNTDIPRLEEWGKFLAPSDKYDRKALSTSQIRKFFGEIKRIQAAKFEESKNDIILLDPKIAYAVGRAEHGAKIKDFYKLVSPMLRDINEDKAKFKNFVNVIESIVAYHKAAGGK
ncbi:MAG: type III-A CRISPR-associated protein Csm2 [Bacteroidetes bacterium]|jgi:CRISPR-associated protein Csm2|nr:type III-A CRISPR-associated protein Csm2 [Bacteroidota bacterium]